MGHADRWPRRRLPGQPMAHVTSSMIVLPRRSCTRSPPLLSARLKAMAFIKPPLLAEAALVANTRYAPGAISPDIIAAVT
jgi:hypothetical protein